MGDKGIKIKETAQNYENHFAGLRSSAAEWQRIFHASLSFLYSFIHGLVRESSCEATFSIALISVNSDNWIISSRMKDKDTMGKKSNEFGQESPFALKSVVIDRTPPTEWFSSDKLIECEKKSTYIQKI